jgi:hypothetical protein
MASVTHTEKQHTATIVTTTEERIVTSSKSSDDLCQRPSSSTADSEESAPTVGEVRTDAVEPNFKSRKEFIEFTILIIGIVFAMFMMSLNSTVVAPAMSIIATELDALESQTWIATAYLVSMNAFQPLSGKVSWRSKTNLRIFY